MLEATFIQLINRYTTNTHTAGGLWLQIEIAYGRNKRHYHNLLHLQHLLQQLLTVKEQINNWDATLFALYYHDIFYTIIKTDNEEKSARLAEKIMKEINVPDETIEQTRQQILATKSHATSAIMDVNYFTDADLSILGSDWDLYEDYFKMIRKEYTMYATVIYKPGRKKVLQHFLNMEPIFKTEIFFEQFEAQAKLNLNKELALY